MISLENFPNIIPTKFGSNWPTSFIGEDLNKFQPIRTKNCPYEWQQFVCRIKTEL